MQPTLSAVYFIQVYSWEERYYTLLQVCVQKYLKKMLRVGARTVRNALGRSFANAPAQAQTDSTAFKVQDTKDFDDRVKKSKVPVIVDFFATWCNPCRMLTPRIESVIAEKQGKVLLAKVDIDENSDLALDYEVGSVPVLIAMKDGKVLERVVGLQDVDKLKQFVDKYTTE
ncbi:thioredoxin [Augochlora pura]